MFSASVHACTLSCMHVCIHMHVCMCVFVYVYTIAIHVIVFGCVSVMMCVCVCVCVCMFDPGAKLKDFQPRARKTSDPHRLFAGNSVVYC